MSQRKISTFSMKIMAEKTRHALPGALALVLAVCAGGVALGQAPVGSTTPAGSTELNTAVQTQRQLSAPGPAVNPQSSTSQSALDPSFKGSIVSGKATGEVLPLSLDDAMQRGLRTNLGVVLQSSNERQANGSRLEDLQKLLPTASASASYTVQQVDLAAYGLKFPGISPIIGPFQVMDFRAYLTQNLVNLQAFQTYMAAKHNFQAAKLTAQDARDLVVLTVGNAYLLLIADEARVKAVQAELDSTKLSLNQATAAHEAGCAAGAGGLSE
jgi:outer membrane protein TolC